MKRITDSAAWTGLRVFLVCISLARLLIPSFDLFYEEEIMSLFDIFNSLFDSNLFVWIIYIWILGQVLKKANLPKWMPSIPVLLLLASFTVCALFGWSHTTQTGGKAVFITVVEYGLFNGGLVWLVASGSYDVGHTFMKEKFDSIKAFISKTIDAMRKRAAKKRAERIVKAQALINKEEVKA